MEISERVVEIHCISCAPPQLISQLEGRGPFVLVDPVIPIFHGKPERGSDEKAHCRTDKEKRQDE
jgi:hypothetical protein